MAKRPGIRKIDIARAGLVYLLIAHDERILATCGLLQYGVDRGAG